MISLSIVVPVYSGADYLRDLVREIDKLKTSLSDVEKPYQISEVVFVNDAAKDASGSVLSEIKDIYPWVSVLQLSKNFGQHPATVAGILHTSGDWVVTIDEDLQHPPARIPELLKVAIESEADIVYGNPKKGVHQSITRDFTSRNYKRLIERLTGNRSIRTVNSFRLIRGTIARGAASSCGYDTYFDIALSWFSDRVEKVVMPLTDLRYVESGNSGYRFKSLLSHARRLAFSSQIKLLRVGTMLGAGMLALSFGIGLILTFVRLFAPQLIASPGWTSLMLTICFFSGATMFLVGLVLEYISILVLRAHGKPLYFIVDRQSDNQLKSHFAKSE